MPPRRRSPRQGRPAGAEAGISDIRPLPGLLMVPDTFASPAEQDAFFADLQLRLEMAARAQRAYIDSHCHIWPCQATDVDCPNPICERQRVLVEEQLEIRLDEIPALRAQTKIVAPSEGSATSFALIAKLFSPRPLRIAMTAASASSYATTDAGLIAHRLDEADSRIRWSRHSTAADGSRVGPPRKGFPLTRDGEQQ